MEAEDAERAVEAEEAERAVAAEGVCGQGEPVARAAPVTTCAPPGDGIRPLRAYVHDTHTDRRGPGGGSVGPDRDALLAVSLVRRPRER